MKTRIWATIGPPDGPVRTRHTMGLPPELTGGVDLRPDMPRADVVLIEDDGDSAMCYRYAGNGGFGGDTWHESLEDALSQLEFEYGAAVGDWREVPAGVENAHAYVVEQVSSTLPGREKERGAGE